MSTYTYILVAILGGAGLCYLVKKMKNKSTTNKNDDQFLFEIIGDLCMWFSDQSHIEKEILFDEFKKLFDGKKSTVLDPYLFDFEIEITQTNPRFCLRTIFATVKINDEEIVCGELSKKVNWDELPSNLRKEIIMSGKDRIRFELLVQSEDEEKSRQKTDSVPPQDSNKDDTDSPNDSKQNNE